MTESSACSFSFKRQRQDSFNGSNEKRFEAKKVRNYAHLSDERTLTYHTRSCPSTDAQNQQQTKPTTLSSMSSPTAGRETPNEQRGVENRALHAGTAAYTQYGVEETFGPEPQRSSPNNTFAYPITIQHHDLQDQGLQTSGASSVQNEHRGIRMEHALSCPYHRSILQGHPTNAWSGCGLSPMDRYVAEGPSERYAVLHRRDAGYVSTHNGCRCFELMQSGVDTNGHTRK